MTPDTHTDGYRSWALGIAALREINIRNGNIRPDPDRPDELRWKVEGPRDNKNLDTVRRGIKSL